MDDDIEMSSIYEGNNNRDVDLDACFEPDEPLTISIPPAEPSSSSWRAAANTTAPAAARTSQVVRGSTANREKTASCE
jgi:hypothetical protein